MPIRQLIQSEVFCDITNLVHALIDDYPELNRAAMQNTVGAAGAWSCADCSNTGRISGKSSKREVFEDMPDTCPECGSPDLAIRAFSTDGEITAESFLSVSGWLADKLVQADCLVVEDFLGSLNIWGRPADAPPLEDDPVLRKIADEEFAAHEPGLVVEAERIVVKQDVRKVAELLFGRFTAD